MFFNIIAIVFWLCLLLVLHSYVLFPVLLKVLSIGKNNNSTIYLLSDKLPSVSILLALYNEEKVIEQKIVSTFNTNYPIDKITFYIGSDASNDGTNGIIEDYQNRYSQIKFQPYTQRSGKSSIINQLSTLSDDEIIILTDANVFFNPDTIYHLVKHYKNENIGIVGGNILNQTHKKEGISYQEKTYLTLENKIKYCEGLIWGAMIGVFGGCFSIRKNLLVKVPANFIVDDFYIAMNVLKQNYKAINELEAICYEDVSNKISEEFRRKKRISAGNFQNLSVYKNLLWTKSFGISFSFFSHKVLRWCAPIFIIINIITCFILAITNQTYQYIFIVQITSLSIPIIDFMLKKIKVNVKLFRFITHFYLMNLALLQGFFQYLAGIKSGIWEPTERNQ